MGVSRFNVMLNSDNWEWVKNHAKIDDRSGSYILNKLLADFREKIEKPRLKAEIKPVENAVMWIPLNSGEFGVTSNDINSWSLIYPAVDVESELRAMVGWCDANPSKRKTNAGIKKFINSWLKRCQDKGGSSNFSNNGISQKMQSNINNAVDWANE